MKPSYFRIIFQINCQGAMWSHQQVEWVYMDKNLVKKYVIALYCMYKFSLELCSMHMCQNHISCHSVHKALKDSGPREAVSLFCLCLCTWDMYWVYFFFCLSWAVNFHRQCNCAFQNTWLYLSEGDEGILGSIIWWTGGGEVAFCPCGHLSGCRNNRTKQLDCLWSTLQSLEEGLVSEMSGLILFVLSGAFILWILFILQPSCCHWSYLVGRITVYVWGKELKSGWKCFFFKGCLIRLEKVYFICIRWVVKEWRNNIYER